MANSGRLVKPCLAVILPEKGRVAPHDSVRIEHVLEHAIGNNVVSLTILSTAEKGTERESKTDRVRDCKMHGAEKKERRMQERLERSVKAPRL